MTDLTIVRTAVSPLVILSTLERAHAALADGDIALGRQFVDGALRRLERAKADQGGVLDDEVRNLGASTVECRSVDDRRRTCCRSRFRSVGLCVSTFARRSIRDQLVG
jgi:hypothetical protein